MLAAVDPQVVQSEYKDCSKSLPSDTPRVQKDWLNSSRAYAAQSLAHLVAVHTPVRQHRSSLLGAMPLVVLSRNAHSRSTACRHAILAGIQEGVYARHEALAHSLRGVYGSSRDQYAIQLDKRRRSSARRRSVRQLQAETKSKGRRFDSAPNVAVLNP